VVAYGQEGYALGISSGSDRCPARPRELFLTRVGLDGVLQGVIIPNTNWHHVAVTKSQGAVVFYLDGVGTKVATSYDPGFSFATSLSIGIRADILEDAFPGLIDEVEIYNRALSASEILMIFNAGSAGKCKPKLCENEKRALKLCRHNRRP
jgi:Concanavalin A-like lectin/glucanases superfamily